MKRWILALALPLTIALPGTAARAQTATVTATHILDENGNPLATGRFCFGSTCLRVLAGALADSNVIPQGTANIAVTRFGQELLTVKDVAITTGSFNWDTFVLGPMQSAYGPNPPLIPAAVGASYTQSQANQAWTYTSAGWILVSSRQVSASGMYGAYGPPTFLCTAPCSYTQTDAATAASSVWALVAPVGRISSNWVNQSGSGGASSGLTGDVIVAPGATSATVNAVGGMSAAAVAAAAAKVAAISGAVVGTTDAQTLTNKTVNGVSPATMANLDATSSVQTQLNGKVPTGSSTTINSIPCVIGGACSITAPAVPGGAAGTLQVNASGALGGVVPTTPLHASSSAITIDQASDAQPGYLSSADHMVLPGISPVGMETTAGDLTGLHNLFSSPTRCPVSGSVVGCTAYVPPGYTYNAVGNGAAGGYGWGHAGFMGRGQALIDRTRGNFRILANNPLIGNDNTVPTLFDVEGKWQYSDSMTHVGINTILNDSAAGLNNGSLYDYSFTTAPSGWSGSTGFNLNMNIHSQGITQVMGYTARKASPGDFNDYDYKYTYGGWRSPADEATQMHAGQLLEAPSEYRGRPTSKVNDYVYTAPIVGSYADIGEGMRAFDMTPASQIWSGYVTTHSTFGDLGDSHGGGVYELLGLGGGATVTPSKYCVTLDNPIDVPTTPSTNDPATGLMNTPTTSVTFAVTLGASTNCSAGAGTPAVGDYITLGQPFHEVVKLTAVTSPSSGHYNLTAGVGLAHRAGQNGWESSYAGAGIFFVDNTATTTSNGGVPINDPSGIPVFNDVVGYPDSTHVVAVKYQQGHLENMELNNNFGNVDFEQIQLDSMTNTGGVATLLFYEGGGSGWGARKFGYPVVTISNSANAAFNGQCTHVRNYRYNSGGKFSVDCDQASSTGQSQGYSAQTPLMAFGTTAYGNTQATIVPMAKILDVNTYPAYPSCYATTCEAVVSGGFRLGPNKMPLPTDGTGVLLAAHDNAAEEDFQDSYMTVLNPQALGHLAHFTIGGAGVNSNFYGMRIENLTPYTLFTGFGSTNAVGLGNQTVPISAVPIGGLFQHFLKADMAPARGGDVVGVECPATGCTDATYFYNALDFALSSGRGQLQFFPSLNKATFQGALWEFASQTRYQGILQFAVGSAITSAATITPFQQIFHVTGTSAISTMTPPSACNATSTATATQQNGVSYGCQVTLIPDALWTTTAGTGLGSFALGTTAVVKRALIETFDTGTGQWYPSY